MMNKRAGAFTVLFVFFSISCFAGESDLVITTWCGAPFSKPDQTGYLDQMLAEALKRIGLENQKGLKNSHSAASGQSGQVSILVSIR